MLKTQLFVSAITAWLVLGSGGVFAASPHSTQAGAELYLAASSVDPDFPSGLEHKRKPKSESQRPTSPSPSQPTDSAQRSHSESANHSGPAKRKYEATPNNAADPDWPSTLGTGTETSDRQRSSPRAGASNQGVGSVDPDWPANHD